MQNWHGPGGRTRQECGDSWRTGFLRFDKLLKRNWVGPGGGSKMQTGRSPSGRQDQVLGSLVKKVQNVLGEFPFRKGSRRQLDLPVGGQGVGSVCPGLDNGDQEGPVLAASWGPV